MAMLSSTTGGTPLSKIMENKLWASEDKLRRFLILTLGKLSSLMWNTDTLF